MRQVVGGGGETLQVINVNYLFDILYFIFDTNSILFTSYYMDNNK